MEDAEERWRQLRFEFQPRRQTENESWAGRGGTWTSQRVATAWRTSVAAASHTCATVSVFMLDSGMEEDVTLPGTLSGCSDLHPILPSELDGINGIAGLGNGGLPNVSQGKVWPTRAWNMKDFENPDRLKSMLDFSFGFTSHLLTTDWWSHMADFQTVLWK
ncbi:hypothetical protein ACRRTK_017145 [Alexandromys fortis]